MKVKYLYTSFIAVDIFLPTLDSLLVNLNENRQLVADLLKQLPTMFEKNMETGSALGPALQAAYKLMVSVTVVLANPQFLPSSLLPFLPPSHP